MSENLKFILSCVVVLMFLAFLVWRVPYCWNKKVIDMTGFDLQVCGRH